MEKLSSIVRIPYIIEQILEGVSTDTLIQCLKVSSTLKVPAKKVIQKRFKGKLAEACKNGQKQLVKLILDNFDSVDSELNATHQVGSTQMTAFMWACEEGHENVVKLLLNHPNCKNIDFNVENGFGFTAFLFACHWGRIEIVKLLLDHPKSTEINFNAKTWDGDTGLMLACGNDNIEMVQLLLDHPHQHQIDYKAKTTHGGKTALRIARLCGNRRIVGLLRKYGIKS